MQRKDGRAKTTQCNVETGVGLGEGLLLQDMLAHTIIQDDICYNYR